jgi:hypothetical protein
VAYLAIERFHIQLFPTPGVRKADSMAGGEAGWMLQTDCDAKQMFLLVFVSGILDTLPTVCYV